MLKCRALLSPVLAATILAPVLVQAQQGAPAKVMTLSALDYAEIQQLSARYAFAIDSCTNSGYDYADLYTDDGEFSVSQEWGKAGARKTKARGARQRRGRG